MNGATSEPRERDRALPEVGFNAQTEEYEDLLKAGVLDPTKVVRTALQNAASVAGLLLTTTGGRDPPQNPNGNEIPLRYLPERGVGS